MTKMIKCSVLPHDAECRLFDLWLSHVPRAGELLWLNDDDREALRAVYPGATSVRVVEVAHWVTSKVSPATHTGAVQSVALMVMPQGGDYDHGAGTRDDRGSGQ